MSSPHSLIILFAIIISAIASYSAENSDSLRFAKGWPSPHLSELEVRHIAHETAVAHKYDMNQYSETEVIYGPREGCWQVFYYSVSNKSKKVCIAVIVGDRSGKASLYDLETIYAQQGVPGYRRQSAPQPEP